MSKCLAIYLKQCLCIKKTERACKPYHYHHLLICTKFNNTELLIYEFKVEAKNKSKVEKQVVKLSCLFCGATIKHI